MVWSPSGSTEAGSQISFARNSVSYSGVSQTQSRNEIWLPASVLPLGDHTIWHCSKPSRVYLQPSEVDAAVSSHTDVNEPRSRLCERKETTHRRLGPLNYAAQLRHSSRTQKRLGCQSANVLG